MAAGDVPAILTGNIGTDVGLRYFPNSDKPYLDLRLATTPRVWSKEQNGWVDAAPMWTTVRAFGPLAEHAAESFRLGDRIIVQGKWVYKEWEKAGEKRSAHFVEAQDMGLSVKFDPVAGRAPQTQADDDQAPY